MRWIIQRLAPWLACRLGWHNYEQRLNADHLACNMCGCGAYVMFVHPDVLEECEDE